MSMCYLTSARNSICQACASHPLSLTTMALQCPGSSTSALALTAGPTTATGKDKLEPRLLAILSQAGVKDDYLNKLGDADCDTVAVFAHSGFDDKRGLPSS